MARAPSRLRPPSRPRGPEGAGGSRSAGGSRGPLRRAARAALAPALLAALLAPAGLAGQEEGETPEPPPTIQEKTRGMDHREGWFDLYWDEEEGRLYLEIDRWREEFLYQVSLATGLGSNPVGLDRGQLGDTRIVAARRVGPRVLLVEPNYDYRALDADAAEERAVREAFAPATIWSFEVAARTGDRVLVDATDFFLRDAHGVARRLRETGQGEFRLDTARSVVHLPGTRAFPENTEVEASLTFEGEDPGPLVRRTAADPRAVTLRQHHSLVELPDGGYEPRTGDPRVGAFGITFRDYARPIDRDLAVRWVSRHRLRAEDPGAALSEPEEPLVYHVDPGIPEPVRSAVIEGASWWEQAFRAAGFEDAFRVEVLPEGADPLDVRYNVIHWTHRRTRGWSYGASVVDPRTGEILKANVNLGSLRLRQDRLLGQGLTPPRGSGHPMAGVGGACDLGGGPSFGYLADVAAGTTPTELALARVRQLAAHEVGHTLGLAHNFAASTYGRASVMDYPAPLVRLGEDGTLDLSDAYDVGIGAYDEFAVAWLYSDFPAGTDEAAALDSIVRAGLEAGHRFLSDADARPAGAAHPLAGLWDNGADPVEALRHEMRVREAALGRFGPEAVREGEPLASLEEVLVPLYLHHRYQTEVTAHTLGGVDYRYAVRGDGQAPVRRVPGRRQRAALEVLLSTLDARALALPEDVLETLPPRAFGMPEGETFDRRTAPTFDYLEVASAAARYTLRYLLQPQRMARLVDQAARHGGDEGPPGLREVARRLLEATWHADAPAAARLAAVHRVVERAVLDRLLEEAARPANPARVRGVLEASLQGLARRLEARDELSPHRRDALETIRRFQRREQAPAEPSREPELPPGSPIGGGR